MKNNPLRKVKFLKNYKTYFAAFNAEELPTIPVNFNEILCQIIKLYL